MNIIKLMMAFVAPAGLYVLASFHSEAMGIKFYDVLTSSVCVGLSLECKLEPLNHYDSNCNALLVSSSAAILPGKKQAAIKRVFQRPWVSLPNNLVE